MADRHQEFIRIRKTEATNELHQFLLKEAAAERLPDSRLKRFKNYNFVAGWQLSRAFSDGNQRILLVLVNASFPYEPPRIAIDDAPSVLTWPHLEAGGLLCLLPPDAATTSERPTCLVRHLLDESYTLIDASIAQSNTEDFRLEFQSYWERVVSPDTPPVTGLLEPRGPSRRIAVWRRSRWCVVGDDQERIEAWVRNRSNQVDKRWQKMPSGGALIWLPEPLIPAEFPSTAAELLALVRRRVPDTVEILKGLAASIPPSILLLLGSASAGGACFGAILVQRPRRNRGRGQPADPISKGFRPGRVPAEITLDRYFCGTEPVTKATVDRADHSWVHGRDCDPRQEQLRKGRVAFLGCGSVGGATARLVAQAGVGNILLVDSTTLERANTCRHTLGARSVEKNKAEALKAEILSALPHLTSVDSRKIRVGPQAEELLKEIATYDLIVSTLGNWTTESFLNQWQQSTSASPPILYGWVESRALAAHATLILSGQGCLRCGVNDVGRPNLEVTEWPDDRRSIQVPACGALFSPYGPAELCWAHALISEAVIDALVNPRTQSEHRAWIGSRNSLRAQGGRWAESWLSEVDDPGEGGVTIKRPWPKSTFCPVCAHSDSDRDD